MRHIVLSCACAATLLAVRPSFAQATPAPLAQSLTGDAKAEYDAGKNLFEIGDFGGALLKFRHAFELSKEPRLLWNMAACEKELHHYARAVTFVERYLREAGDRITPQTRASATATMDALRSLYSRATLAGVPDGAQVSVDGENAGTTPLPSPLPLDVGSHKIRVDHPDYEPFETSANDITGGGDLIIQVSMVRLTAGQLQIVAGPGDTITVDGKVLGSDRWEGGLPPGRHTVRVTARGKKPYEAEVELAPRGFRSVHVTLQAESSGPLWPWIAGGVALVGGAVVGGYFLFKPEDPAPAVTPGGLSTVYLPTASFR
jgi:hypothetical protein